MIVYQDELVTLYHGDSREILYSEDLRADVLITDPPYGVDKHGQMIGWLSPNWDKKETHSRGFADHDKEAFANLIGPVFDLVSEYTLPAGGMSLVFGGNRTLHQQNTFLEDAGFDILDLIVFQKNGVAKSPTTLKPAFEVATLGRKKGPVTHINPDWTKSNICPVPYSRTPELQHLTPKPLGWMEWCVELVTQPGQTVIDPFAGSATTLVAARNLGRKVVGIERDEGYAEEARKRLERDSG